METLKSGARGGKIDAGWTNSLNLRRLCVMATSSRVACFVLSYFISMGRKVCVKGQVSDLGRRPELSQ
jgi:hypothetical protein